MGIKGLNSFLKEKCGPDYQQKVPMVLFRYKKIAIDASIFLFKYKYLYGSKSINGYIDLICKLKSKKIHPVFVFDGKSPVEKDAEKLKRKIYRDLQEERVNLLQKDFQNFIDSGIISLELAKIYEKNKPQRSLVDVEFDSDIIVQYIAKLQNGIIKITAQDYIDLKDVLEKFNIFWIQASGEAENTCSQLCKQGLVSAVLTSDTDVMASHCPIMLKEMQGDYFIQVKINDLLNNLNWTKEQFTDFCIMCGTDFNNNIPKIGPKRAFDLIDLYKKIDNIPLDTSILNYKRTRILFTHEEYLDEIKFSKPINFIELEKWIMYKDLKYNIQNLKDLLG